MSTNHTPEEYRRIAEKCREAARTVSAEEARADLLARAETWDLIAGRICRGDEAGVGIRGSTAR